MPLTQHPAGANVWIKLRTQPVTAFQKSLEFRNAEVDSDSVLAGMQNEGRFEVAHNPASEKYDVLVQTINEQGQAFAAPNLRRTTISTTLSALMNADVDTLSLTLAPTTRNDDIEVGSILRIDDEYLVVKTIDTANPRNVTVDERGAHGSVAASHSSGVAVAVYEWTLPNSSITLTGQFDTAKPNAPFKFFVESVSASAGALQTKIQVEMPTTQIHSLRAYEVQVRPLSAGLWPDDTQNTLDIRGIQVSGTGLVIHGGIKMTTTTDFAAYIGKLLYTHEGIDLVTGEVDFPKVYIIKSSTSIGGGKFDITVEGGDEVFQISKGIFKTINFIVFDNWARPPDSELDHWIVGPPNSDFKSPVDPISFVGRHVLFILRSAYYRARWLNFFGTGPWVYWDGVDGSTTKADAVAVGIVKIAVASTIFDDGAIGAISLEPGGRNFTTDLDIVSVDNDTVSWIAATIRLADGTEEAIATTGSPKTLSAPGIHYVYKIIGNSTLQFTTDFRVAIGTDRVLIGQVITTTVTTEFASWISDKTAGGSIVGVAVAAVGKLSALSVDAGELTAGTVTGLLIRTASGTGRRVELTTTGLTTYDASNNALVKLNTSGVDPHIDIVASATVPGKIRFGSNSEMRSGVLGSDFSDWLPQTDKVGTLTLGSDVVGLEKGFAVLKLVSRTLSTDTPSSIIELVTWYTNTAIKGIITLEPDSFILTQSSNNILTALNGETVNVVKKAGSTGDLFTVGNGTTNWFHVGATAGAVTLNDTFLKIIQGALSLTLDANVSSSTEINAVGGPLKIITNDGDIVLSPINGVSDADVIPGVDNAYDLGTNSFRWKSLAANIIAGTELRILLDDATEYLKIKMESAGGRMVIETIGADVGQHLLIQTNLGDLIVDPASNNFIPENDNDISNGTSGSRWADVRSVLINGADVAFLNGWRFRELGVTPQDLGYDKLDGRGSVRNLSLPAKTEDWFLENAANGITLMDDEGNTTVVFHKNGNVYIKGQVLPISLLPVN